MAPPSRSPEPPHVPQTTFSLAVRQSAYTENPPHIMFPDMNYADAPNMWVQAGTYVYASCLVWLEPYKRPMTITLQCPDYANAGTELQILAADDVESVVQAAMQEDASRTGEERQARLEINHLSNGMYHPQCIAVLTDDRTKKRYWWQLFVWQADSSKGEREGRRMPSEEEEEGREWLGQRQWRGEEEWETKYMEQEQDEAVELNGGLDLGEVGMQDDDDDDDDEEEEEEEEVIKMSDSEFETLMSLAT